MDIRIGCCVETMRAMPDGSVDSVVTDPFFGSGTTGVAATAGGFKFIGIEKDPEYAAIAILRNEAAR